MEMRKNVGAGYDIGTYQQFMIASSVYHTQL